MVCVGIISICQCLAISGAQAAAADPQLAAQLDGLRAADIQLDRVRYRLALANDELCAKHGPLTGLIIASSNDYDADIRDSVVDYLHFATPILVEGVVADSPAARAGVQAGDSIAAIDGVAIDADEGRTAALEALDAGGPRKPILLTLRRKGASVSATIDPVEGCLAHAEVAISSDLNAATDGTTMQVDSALINLVGNDDQALASIVAHELAHVVLDHPDRLTAAHVDRGLLRGFGRNKRLITRTENEADRLSVTLMANAGYDPQAAVRYWLTYGPQLNDHGGFMSTHLSWRERADLIAKAAAAIPANAPRPIIPAWIASRDQPLR
jgi:hypothetical protein